MSAGTTPGWTVRLAALGALLLAVSCGEAAPEAAEGTTRAPTPTEPDVTVSPTVTAAAPATDVPAASATPPATETWSTSAPAASPPSSPPLATGEDGADRYLGETSEIYRRTLDDGVDVVLRQSAGTYASVFGAVWTAPTGSADSCLGDRALFLGVPGRMGWWGSAWTAVQWFDEPLPVEVVRYLSTMPVADPGAGTTVGTTVASTSLLLVQTRPDAAEVVLATNDGEEIDRAPVIGGFAVLQYAAESDVANPFTGQYTLLNGAGTSTGPVLLAGPEVDRPACGPGEPPVRPLPDAGAQPADATVARQAIVDRFLTLVDTAVPWADKTGGLVDDETGVAAAVDGLATSPFADLAASASYSVDELVFTAPDEAWFRYTITTSASTWPDRIGRAVQTGDEWQITRATVCQDLSLAMSPCTPGAEPVQLPPDPEWQAAWEAWIARANLYMGNDGCMPLTPC